MKDARGEWSAFLALWLSAAAGGWLCGRGWYGAGAVALLFAAALAAGGYVTHVDRAGR